MLDPKLVREKPDAVKAGLETRGAAFDIAGVPTLDEKRRGLITQVEAMKMSGVEEYDIPAFLRKQAD